MSVIFSQHNDQYVNVTKEMKVLIIFSLLSYLLLINFFIGL